MAALGDADLRRNLQMTASANPQIFAENSLFHYVSPPRNVRFPCRRRVSLYRSQNVSLRSPRACLNVLSSSLRLPSEVAIADFANAIGDKMIAYLIFIPDELV